jgi:hypothetical protein
LHKRALLKPKRKPLTIQPACDTLSQVINKEVLMIAKQTIMPFLTEEDIISAYFARLGKMGGEKKTERKVATARRNVAKAHAVRMANLEKRKWKTKTK